MGPGAVRRFARTDGAGEQLMRQATVRLALSARAYHRVLKLARTIADLDGKDIAGAAHVAEALQYRPRGRGLTPATIWSSRRRQPRWSQPPAGPSLVTAQAYQSAPAVDAPIIGRGSTLAALDAVLVEQGVRLVTLIGPGGVGKTRLASEAGRTLAGAFPAGSRLVDLSVVGSRQAVLPAILRALGASDRDASTEDDLLTAVTRAAEVRPRLLILDNAEHLSAGPLIGRLVDACPALTVLVTSRVILRVPQERRVSRSPARPTGRPGLARRRWGLPRHPRWGGGGGPLRRPRRRRPPGLPAHGGERRGRRGAVRPAGRAAAGHRAGRPPG